MNAVPDTSLAGFPREHMRAQTSMSSRVAAGLLTVALYALLVFLADHRTIWMGSTHAMRREIITRLMPDPPPRRTPLPKFLVHLIRPRPQSVAAPAFAIASDAPAGPALLPASAAKTSPMAGGVPDGPGTMSGQVGTATGNGGNGSQMSGCYDAAWAQAVTKRIGQFYYYPQQAAMHHIRGVVFVHFIVRQNGQLEMLEVGQSSGDRSLDNAAYDMVKKAQPLPAIPERMHADRVDARFPIGLGDMKAGYKATDGSCPG
jgi:protein TonB